MPRSLKAIASELSLDELRQLLAVKEKLTTLEKRKAQLEKDLAKVEARIAKLITGAKQKKVTRKKVAKKTVKAKRRTMKKAAKKTVKKAAKKTVVKKTRKTVARKPRSGKPTVESVVADLIRKQGKPMAFQDILSVITRKKLIKTKSKNFANVLRRTLSTSKLMKRAGRGIYGLK